MQPARPRPVLFWIVTGLLGLGMVAGGLAQLFRAQANVDGMLRLGYPLYVLTIIAVWKLAGITVVLLPGLRLAKEWAYAGLFFLLVSGSASHLASGEGVLKALPAFGFACLTAISWYLRPASRRVPATPNPAVYASRAGARLVEATA